jgi:DNA-binding PadR family transcriptional regulator
MDALGDPAVASPLTPAEFHILLALADQDRHGYAIMQHINEAAGSTIRIGPATLYRSIKRLLDAGLIEELDERPDPGLDDERRRYYKLTDVGRRVAKAELERLQRLIDTYAKHLFDRATPCPEAWNADVVSLPHLEEAG